VSGSDKYFYIGLTSLGVSLRLSMHLSSVRSGSDPNKKKSDVIKENNFLIESVLLSDFFSTKKKAILEENRYISEYFRNGHPLTNKISGEVLEYKTLKVPEKYHQELKVFCAQNDMPLSFVVGQGVAMYIAKHKEAEVKVKKAKQTTKTK
jgi:hypothetical protein